MHMRALRDSAWAGLVLALAAGPVWAIDLGDPAPAVKVKEWVKGQGVDLKKGKGRNIYVIEFWATWCPPCRASIPHLTEVQKKFKEQGVIVVGISDEPLDKVKPFVEQQGDKMDYVVAVDPDRHTHRAYMEAFRVNGIPHAFIVDQTGALVWHGHPMDGLDEALAQILDGTYDLKAAKEAAKLPQMLEQYFELVTSGPKTSAKKAAKLGRQIVKLGGKNAQLLNAFAWTILTDEQIKKPDLKLALQAAQAANEASKGEDAAILDTYALALWKTGDRKAAVQHQKKAVELCEDARVKRQLQKTLDRYEKELAAGGAGDGAAGHDRDGDEEDGA
mgnify:CR=1 FL=1